VASGFSSSCSSETPNAAAAKGLNCPWKEKAQGYWSDQAPFLVAILITTVTFSSHEVASNVIGPRPYSGCDIVIA
jgi:hypothetical protein